MHEVLSALEKNQPGGRTDLPEALRRARPMLKRKGTLVVISDFLAKPEDTFAALNAYIHAGFRIHLFHVLDPGNSSLPDRGLARFKDMETGDQLTSAHHRRARVLPQGDVGPPGHHAPARHHTPGGLHHGPHRPIVFHPPRRARRMSLTFANPSLFALAAAIGLPVLIHLVARSRPPVFAFSSTEFLRRALRETMRVRQPREWLVLLLRTLFIAALIGAFLQPVLVSTSGMAATGQQKSVVLVVDRSASMGAVENGRTRLAIAAEKAAEILDAAGPGTLANVVWLKSTPEAVFPEPGPNTVFLKDSLSRADALPETGSSEAALRLAMAQTANAAGAKEVYLLSDFQETAWKGIVIGPQDGVNVFHVPCAADAVPNTALVSLATVPAEPAAGEPAEVRCGVRNFSPEPIRTSLFLDVGGNRLSRAIDLPPWSETEAVFPVSFPQAGQAALTANIDEDRFPGDDQRFGVAKTREGLQLAIWPEPPPGAPHPWRLAAAAIGTVKPVSWNGSLEDGAARKVDFLLVENWDGTRAGEIAALAESGTAIFLQPGPALPAEAMATVFGAKVGSGTGPVESANGDGWQVAVAAADAPVFKLFRDGEFGDPFAGRVTRRVRIGADWAAAGGLQLLAAYGDGVPALARRDTTGAPVYLFNLPTSASSGTWTAQPVFLPLLGELWSHSRPARSGLAAESPAGSPLVFTPPPGIESGGLELLDATGKAIPLAARAVGGAEPVSSVGSVPPGHYRWTLDKQTLHATAVNFPAEESDLRVLPPSAMAGVEAGATSGASLTHQRDGLPLWPWLVAAALAFLVLEGFALRLPVQRAAPARS